MSGIRVLIAGGRAFDDRERVFKELSLLHAGVGCVAEVLVDDTHAGDYALEWARNNEVPARKAERADLTGALPAGCARVVALAFPDGVVLELRRAGLEVRDVKVA